MRSTDKGMNLTNIAEFSNAFFQNVVKRWRAAIRSRRCWIVRSEKDGLDMAYPIGL